jgi:aspartyl-tRNA(Asn)/glutamyl-tRNA(Gln) amidotransferase subunit B
LPVVLDESFIEAVRQSLPELPDQKAQRFQSQYGLSAYDAQVLTASSTMAGFYEAVAACVPNDSKLAANWVMGELSAALNASNLEIGESRLSALQLGQLLQRIVDNTVSGKLAKEVFEVMWAEQRDADAVIDARGLKQITDTGAIEKLIDDIIAANPKQLAEYRSGKDKLFGFFVGQAMKLSGGKANPGLLNDLLKKKLAP